MRIGMRLMVNVEKIDKSRLYKGEKGTYLNMTCFLDPHNTNKQDHHGMVTESVTKEERDAGKQGTILGNADVFYINDEEGNNYAGDDSPVKRKPPQGAVEGADIEALEDDIPW